MHRVAKARSRVRRIAGGIKRLTCFPRSDTSHLPTIRPPLGTLILSLDRSLFKFPPVNFECCMEVFDFMNMAS